MSIALATKGVISQAGGGATAGSVKLTITVTQQTQLGPARIAQPNQLDVTLRQITQLGP